MRTQCYFGPLDGAMLDVCLQNGEDIMLTLSVMDWNTDFACWRHNPSANKVRAAYKLIDRRLVFMWMERKRS